LQTPDALQLWLLGKQHEGVSGAARPMPRAAEEAPPAPTVGANDAAPSAEGSQRAENSAAQPGFNLR
jgi:hypothetical protein